MDGGEQKTANPSPSTHYMQILPSSSLHPLANPHLHDMQPPLHTPHLHDMQLLPGSPFGETGM